MNNHNFIGPWIKRFLLEYLINIKNLSRNTQQSYRDTFRQYLTYASQESSVNTIDQLIIEDISPDEVKQYSS